MSIAEGSRCAVATCIFHSDETECIERTDITYHRFPEDPILLNMWAQKCMRGNDWNPSKEFICSEHFKWNDFVYDMENELLGYTQKAKKLKPNVQPSLNLPKEDLNIKTLFILEWRQRVEAELFNEPRVLKTGETTSSTLLSDEDTIINENISKPDIETFHKELLKDHDNLEIENKPLKNENELQLNHETSYMELLKDNDNLKTENEQLKNELSSLKTSYMKQKESNKSLSHRVRVITKNFKCTNKVLKQTRISMIQKANVIEKLKKQIPKNKS